MVVNALCENKRSGPAQVDVVREVLGIQNLLTIGTSRIQVSCPVADTDMRVESGQLIEVLSKTPKLIFKLLVPSVGGHQRRQHQTTIGELF